MGGAGKYRVYALVLFCWGVIPGLPLDPPSRQRRFRVGSRVKSGMMSEGAATVTRPTRSIDASAWSRFA